MNNNPYIQNAYRCILQNDFEEAIRWFEQALQANPGDAEVHYRCSITYGRSGYLEQAVLHAEKASALQPDQSAYVLHLQHLQARTLVQGARKLLEQPEQYTSTALYQAVQQLKQAVSLDPLDPEAYVWLAMVYSELNEHALAMAALKDVIGLYPQESSLQQLMEELKKRLKLYMHDS
ncbi:tetratricopeptide repeat protein [Paenibacillus sp. JSM ZJ436]|uniref:tetratricopeptide repeat protein n=1 Tax=Paenibacillus sp. JSM ZJ436 TaxID=3376190 RepID=UPI00378BA38C